LNETEPNPPPEIRDPWIQKFLAHLATEAVLRVNPSLLARIGAAEGEQVTVRSKTGRLELPAVTDPSVPAGSALLAWNLQGARASDLIDASQQFTEITVEAAGGGDSVG